MSLPLPAGWFDTGVTKTVEYKCDLSVIMHFPSPEIYTNIFAGWQLSVQWCATGLGVFAIPQPNYSGTAETQIFNYADIGDLDFYDYSAESPSPFFHLSTAIGPLRLGVNIHNGTDGTHPPDVAGDDIASYGWFADEDTQILNTCTNAMPGESDLSYAFSPSPPGTAPILYAFSSMEMQSDADNFGAAYRTVWPYVAKVTGLSMGDALVDTTGIPGYDPATFPIVGHTMDVSDLGLGTITYKAPPESLPNYSSTDYAIIPYQFSYDVAASKFQTGANNLGAEFTDRFLTVHQYKADGVTDKSPYAPYFTSTAGPFTTSESSWDADSKSLDANLIQFGYLASWVASQDPQEANFDRYQLIHAGRPDGPLTYSPLTITLAESISVLRPDGNRPSDFVTSDAAKLTVAESSSETTFTCITAGANAKRTLVGTANWRSRTTPTVAYDGTTYTNTNPDFGFGNELVSKHNFAGWGGASLAEDIWGWSSYRFLYVSVNAPADCTLTMTITSIKLTVGDSHVSGGQRISDYAEGRSEASTTLVYSIPVKSGVTTPYKVDLLFPDSGGVLHAGGIQYPSRVTDMTLAGFPLGDTVLLSMDMKATQGYLKVHYNEQKRTLNMVTADPETDPELYAAQSFGAASVDYGSLWASVDGSRVCGDLGDKFLNNDQVGDVGGSPRYIDPMEGAETGTITDHQVSLGSMTSYIDGWEGFTAVYSTAAHDAVLKDAQGNTLGPSAGSEPAEWLIDIVPYVTLTPGTAYQPPCCPRVGSVIIAPGKHFLITSRGDLWGAMETVVAQAGSPTGPYYHPATLTVKRDDTGAVVGAGTADANGYGIVIVPGNYSNTFTMSAAPP